MSAARAQPLRLDVGRSAAARGVPATRDIGRWAAAALGARGSGRELAVRVVGAGESRRLNRTWRGEDHATNVLSFPAALPPVTGDAARPLGDLVICPSVLAREARAQGKARRAHWAHLVVHGALHLIGYDHEDERDARRMERREIAVLRALGFANPYSSPPRGGR